MTIKLLDWDKKETEVDVGDLEDIATMMIRVVSGDEILEVVYKDYCRLSFDSSCTRYQGFYDGEYDIYDFRKEDNLLTDPRFINRKSSYDFERW